MIIKNALWLSPMEGVSDLGFRSIYHKRGAHLTFVEMIRADAFVKGNKATLDLVDTHLKMPTGLQFLVSKPKILQKALEYVTQQQKSQTKFKNIKCIELNFGCPSKEVIQIGSGPALLKRLNRMKELLTTLKKYSPVPCGIKMRLGLNKREKANKIYLRVIEIANEVGLDWVAVHAKTADQHSRESIDTKALKEIVDIAKIPILGNGFVKDGPSAKKFLDMGCSGVIIARAAITNPWVFEEIEHYLKTSEIVKATQDYGAVEMEYDDVATKYKTRKKFWDYHKRVFALRRKGDFGYHSPSRIKNWI